MLEEQEVLEPHNKNWDDIEVELNIEGDDETLHISKLSLLRKIATFIFVETNSNTTSSAWTVSLEEIEGAFGVSHDFFNKQTTEEILDVVEFWYGEQIAEIYYSEEEEVFDVTLFHDFIAGIIWDDQSIYECRGE